MGCHESHPILLFFPSSMPWLGHAFVHSDVDSRPSCISSQRVSRTPAASPFFLMGTGHQRQQHHPLGDPIHGPSRGTELSAHCQHWRHHHQQNQVYKARQAPLDWFGIEHTWSWLLAPCTVWLVLWGSAPSRWVCRWCSDDLCPTRLSWVHRILCMVAVQPISSPGCHA